MLNKNTFEILKICSLNNINQNDLYEYFNQEPYDELNKKLSDMINANLITNDFMITDYGLEQLDPYKVDNAIIMAAGMSSRFAPLSYEKPKGLLVVKGEILIERQIKQLQDAGIKDITIVVGYKKEQFFYLEKKFGVKIIINEDYYKYNNTSTLMLVTDKLKNTYICSSDNYFTENVFSKYEFNAYYSAEYSEGPTNEYCLSLDKDDYINGVSITGGKGNNWYMIGHVFFSKEFSEKFVPLLKSSYCNNPNTKEKLWEDLYSEHTSELKMKIKRFPKGVINEFDSLDELRNFDDKYVNNTDSTIFQNICKILKCEDKDIIGIEAIKKGLTNTSFKFECKGQKYVYRHPGVGTDEYIHRDSEEFSMKLAKKLNLDDTFIYMDPDEGWKISHYIENARNLNYHNMDEVKQSLSMIRKLHDANIKSKYDFDIIKATRDFIDKISKKGRTDYEDFDELYKKMQKIYELTSKDGIEKRLCHCDCYDPNFLVDENGKMYLIDWEYSGNDDPANDLGTYICCSDYTYEEALKILDIYFGETPSKETLRHYIGYIAISAYYWFVWAIFQESVGNNVGEYLYIWYKDSVLYADKALELYND